MGWALKRRWSNAVRTEVDGITFPSKTEALVYSILKAMLKTGDRLYRQVRLPLLSIGPGPKLVPLALTVDFCLVGANGVRLYVDAKSRTRRSREWVRGKAAAEAAWGIKIEEWDPK